LWRRDAGRDRPAACILDDCEIVPGRSASGPAGHVAHVMLDDVVRVGRLVVSERVGSSRGTSAHGRTTAGGLVTT